jgi:hypothetical protein
MKAIVLSFHMVYGYCKSNIGFKSYCEFKNDRRDRRRVTHFGSSENTAVCIFSPKNAFISNMLVSDKRF